MGDAVEGGGFDHGVVGHVSEDDSLTGDEGFVEGVFVDDVAGEAAHAAEFVGVGFFAGLAAADDVGAVGHFEGVRHVTGGGGVEDGGGEGRGAFGWVIEAGELGEGDAEDVDVDGHEDAVGVAQDVVGSGVGNGNAVVTNEGVGMWALGEAEIGEVVLDVFDGGVLATNEGLAGDDASAFGGFEDAFEAPVEGEQLAAGDDVGEVVDGGATGTEVGGLGEFDDATGDGVEKHIVLGGTFEFGDGACDGGEFGRGDQS